MALDKAVADDAIEKIDPPDIIWLKVRDAVDLLLDDNPKLHDVGALIMSLREHGLQELPKYDDKLGAIKAGNGRIEALWWMERQHEVNETEEFEPPRGVAIDKETGHWVMPIIVGTDAADDVKARAYVLDSNNVGLMGAGFTAIDMARLYDPTKLTAWLHEIGEGHIIPVSIDAGDAEMVMKHMDRQMTPPDEFPEFDEDLEVEFCCPKCGYEWSGSPR